MYNLTITLHIAACGLLYALRPQGYPQLMWITLFVRGMAPCFRQGSLQVLCTNHRPLHPQTALPLTINHIVQAGNAIRFWRCRDSQHVFSTASTVVHLRWIAVSANLLNDDYFENCQYFVAPDAWRAEKRLILCTSIAKRADRCEHEAQLALKHW